MAFFSSGSSSAKVFFRPGTKKMGSYPKPSAPLGRVGQGALALAPGGHRVPIGEAAADGRHEICTGGPAGPACSPAAVCSGPRRPGRDRRTGREYTPGAPLRASTHRPESSAMAGRPVASMTAFAFRRAFSSKVVPVSSTSTSAPTSDSRTHLHPLGGQDVLHLLELVIVLAGQYHLHGLNLPGRPSGPPALPGCPWRTAPTRARCSSRVKARPSPVPWSSTSSPSPVMTQFRSTWAEESSS